MNEDLDEKGKRSGKSATTIPGGGVIYHCKNGGVAAIVYFSYDIIILRILTLSSFFSGYTLFVGWGRCG